MALEYTPPQDFYGPPVYDLSDQSGYPTGYTDVSGLSTSKTTGHIDERSWIGLGVCVFLILGIVISVIFVLIVVTRVDDSDIMDDINAKSKATFSDISPASTANKTVVTAATRPTTPARATPRTSAPGRTRATPAPPVTPAPPPSPATVPTTASRTPQGPPRVTTPPPPLLCSVGATPTAMRPRLPPDGSCDILIYMHVRFYKDLLRPVVSEMSFQTFKNACAEYNHTTCGLSIDAMHTLPFTFASVAFDEHIQELKALYHMDHYGILNLYGSQTFVDSISTRYVPRVLTALRQILGEGPERVRHKVFVGIGYRYFNESNSWSTLTYTASNLASKDVDILVIITSFLSPEDRHDCLTMPVNAMKTPNEYTPALDDASHMAKEGFARPSVIVAFTFLMGVPYYVLTKEYSRPLDALYEPCTMFGLTDYSQACQADTADLNLEKTVIGMNKAESVKLLNDKRIFQSHDTLIRMREKAQIIMERPDTRANLTWLLWNVHLTDVTRNCLSGGPFQRVKGFRDFFYRQAQLPKG